MEVHAHTHTARKKWTLLQHLIKLKKKAISLISLLKKEYHLEQKTSTSRHEIN